MTYVFALIGLALLVWWKVNEETNRAYEEARAEWRLKLAEAKRKGEQHPAAPQKGSPDLLKAGWVAFGLALMSEVLQRCAERVF